MELGGALKWLPVWCILQVVRARASLGFGGSMAVFPTEIRPYAKSLHSASIANTTNFKYNQHQIQEARTHQGDQYYFIAKRSSSTAILQAPRFTWYSLGSSSTRSCTRINITATINLPRNQVSPDDLSIPKIIASRGLVEEFETRTGYTSLIPTTGLEKKYCDHGSIINLDNSKSRSPNNPLDAMVIAKLYAIMESVADRVEMHKNIGAQRDNWNLLLLTSINAITLTAATLAGLAATINASGPPLVALKISSTILYLAATGMLVVMNKIQPSQLAEEQRNSARLFKQLHQEIQTTLAVRDPRATDVSEAMEKVLALDRAYPLPLLGAMLEKFPKAVEPTVWWPPKRQRQVGKLGEETDGNGWDGKLEGEMREIAGILKRKDVADYLKLSKKALKVSGLLAISGPLLTAVGALGSAFVGTIHGTPAVMFAVIGGALASVVNTMEHGGQVGMVFQMYRSTAGLFRLMQETIESNISERDVEGRENGEILKLKVALQLGRSLTELENLAAASSRNYKQAVDQEFASKLF